MQICTDIMSLVANAHPSSAKCELIVVDEYVYVIANALIDKCFFAELNLFQLWSITM